MDISDSFELKLGQYKIPPGRYIKLRVLRNTDGNNDAGHAEVDVITN